jgi:hypothetical protein
VQLNGQIARHCTLQPSDRVLRRMVVTRLHHAGCAISIMIAGSDAMWGKQPPPATPGFSVSCIARVARR